MSEAAWLARPVLTACVIALSACAASPYDFANPIVTPSGGRGFGMTGYVSYTSDQARAEAVVTDRLRAACGGEIRMLRLDMSDASSAAGVPHVRYEAVAECVQ